MATFDVVYRLTVQDADGNAVTPRTSSQMDTHGDEFRVATRTQGIQGVSGYKPYLGSIAGRHGRFHVLEHRPDTGRYTVQILDKKTETSNAKRWVTAFTGDEAGRSHLIGKTVRIDESLDGGKEWTPFFTGKIIKPETDGRVWMKFELRDLAEELDVPVFYEQPSVEYATFGSLHPIGVLRPYGDALLTEPIPGKVGEWRAPQAWGSATGQSGRFIEVDFSRFTDAVADGWYNKVSAQFQQRLQHADSNPTNTGLRVYCEITSGSREGETGEFWAAAHRRRLDGVEDGSFLRVGYYVPVEVGVDGDIKRHGFRSVGIAELSPDDDNYMALPARNTECTFYIRVQDGQVSEDNPLFINDVHPVQLWQDMLNGHFGSHEDDGSAKWMYPYDVEAFDKLISDTRFLKFRGIIEESDTLREWVETHICLPYNLGYRINGRGEVVPFDMRLPDSWDSSTYITDVTDPNVGQGDAIISDGDLDISKAPHWSYDRTGAVTRVDFHHYEDTRVGGGGNISSQGRKAVSRSSRPAYNQAEFPPLPPGRISSSRATFIELNLSSPELGERPLEIDGIGFHGDVVSSDADEQIRTLSAIRAFAKQRIEMYRSPFGYAPQYITVPCRRTNNTKHIHIGRLVELDFELPNPASNTRAGSRLGWCTERQEAGPVVTFTFLDVGDAAVAMPPSFGGAPTLDADDTLSSVLVDVARNSDNDPVEVQVAVTAMTQSSEPAERSDKWMFATRVEQDGEVAIRSLPSGSRIWVRARSVPSTEGSIKLPSPYVSASTYVDTELLPGPTGATTVDVDGCSAICRWVPANGGTALELTFDGEVLPVLPPGTRQWAVEGLETSTRYRWSVRHLDGRGGRSAATGAVFVTPSTRTQVVEPLGMLVLVGRKVR